MELDETMISFAVSFSLSAGIGCLIANDAGGLMGLGAGFIIFGLLMGLAYFVLSK